MERISPVRQFTHRPALDGLRGVAVLGVVAHHAGYLHGGYLGVDLFFVLSGFLITSLLLVEHHNSGTVQLKSFWARRARRLLPASWAVITASALAMAVVASSDRLGPFRRDAFAALGYVENWYQIFAGSDYWDRYAEPSLLRHFWSLAIEEQFYLLWPGVFLGAARLASRWARRFSFAQVLGSFAVVGALSSYVAGILMYHEGEPTTRAYFGTDTRVGAIFLGVFVACAQFEFSHRERADHANSRVARRLEIAAIASLAMLAVSWVGLDGTDAVLWRGGLAVVGVSAATVVATLGSAHESMIHHLFNRRVLIYFGEISYGLYLWHWPIFVLLDERQTDLRGVPLLAVRLVASFAAAVVSARVIERPFRRNRIPRHRAMAAVSAGFLLTVGVTIFSTESSNRGSLAVASNTRPEADGIDEPVNNTPSTLFPSTVVPNIVVFGDSVGVNLGDSLETLAPSSGFLVHQASIAGCPITTGQTAFRNEKGEVFPDPPECDGYLASWPSISSAASANAALLVIGSPTDALRHIGGDVWADACEPEYKAWMAEGVRTGLASLTAQGLKIGVTTIPYFRGFGYPERADALTDCRNEVVASVAREFTNVKLIDLKEFVCPKRECIEEIDGFRLRTDGVHFTPETVDYVATWVINEFLGR